jgi:hypothetical protein
MASGSPIQPIRSLIKRHGLKDFCSGIEKLRQGVPGFNNEQEVRDWLKAPFFKPIWDLLYSDCLRQRYESAKGRSRANVRGPGFEQAVKQILDGKSFGRRMFSRPRPDKPSWTEVEHLAYVLCQVAHENTANQDGIFHLGLKTRAKVVR